MLALPAELVIQCSFEISEHEVRLLLFLSTAHLQVPAQCGTSNLGKQSFKTAVSFGVAHILKDNWAWSYLTLSSSLTLGLKEKERKKSDVGSTGPALTSKRL